MWLNLMMIGCWACATDSIAQAATAAKVQVQVFPNSQLFGDG